MVSWNSTNGTEYGGDEAVFVEDPSELLFEFVTNGILLNLVGVLGVVGNIISIVILSRPQMRSSINYLLTGLAKCDTVLILTSIFLFGFPAIYKYTATPFLAGYFFRVYPFLCQVAYPLALIAQTVSVYLTLTVTLERYVAVCRPLQARSLCTYGRARLYVILIIVFSSLYNLPRFWEISLISEYDPELNATVYTPVPSDMRNDRLYITVYIHWCYLIFIYFLPFSFLALFNSAIYIQVRKANQERQRLSRLQKKEIGLATMLLCVVSVFFICNFLALITNILEPEDGTYVLKPVAKLKAYNRRTISAFYGIIVSWLVKLSNFLVTINSSVNFIIYVIFGEKFKRLFLKLFCTGAPKICLASGRDSPDMHEDSIMLSNGDGRSLTRGTESKRTTLSGFRDQRSHPQSQAHLISDVLGSEDGIFDPESRLAEIKYHQKCEVLKILSP